MDTNSKAFELFWEIYHKNPNFHKIIAENFANGKIRFFNDTE